MVLNLEIHVRHTTPLRQITESHKTAVILGKQWNQAIIEFYLHDQSKGHWRAQQFRPRTNQSTVSALQRGVSNPALVFSLRKRKAAKKKKHAIYLVLTRFNSWRGWGDHHCPKTMWSQTYYYKPEPFQWNVVLMQSAGVGLDSLSVFHQASYNLSIPLHYGIIGRILLTILTTPSFLRRLSSSFGKIWGRKWRIGMISGF